MEDRWYEIQEFKNWINSLTTKSIKVYLNYPDDTLSLLLPYPWKMEEGLIVRKIITDEINLRRKRIINDIIEEKKISK